MGHTLRGGRLATEGKMELKIRRGRLRQMMLDWKMAGGLRKGFNNERNVDIAYLKLPIMRQWSKTLPQYFLSGHFSQRKTQRTLLK